MNSCVNCGSTELSAVNIAAGGNMRGLPESFRLYTRFCPRPGSTAPFNASEAYHSGLASPASLMQLENLLEAYLEYHLERKFNLSQTIKNLKAKMMI